MTTSARACAGCRTGSAVARRPGVAAGALIVGATAVLDRLGRRGARPRRCRGSSSPRSSAVAAWGLVAALTQPPRRLVFRLVMTAALLLALQLVLAGNLTG